MRAARGAGFHHPSLITGVKGCSAATRIPVRGYGNIYVTIRQAVLTLHTLLSQRALRTSLAQVFSRVVRIPVTDLYSSLVKVPPREMVKSNGPGRPAARRAMPGRQRTSSSASSFPSMSLPVTMKPRSLADS